MALNAANVQSLVDELQRERAAYLASAEKTHELLRALLESKSGPLLDDVENPFRSRQCSVAMPNGLSRAKQRAAHSNLATDIEVESLPSGRSLSSLTGDDSDSESEGNESNFVSTPLQAHEYTDSDFRAHLRDHVWQPEALAILGNLVGEDMKIKKDVLSREQLLPATKEEEEADRSCLTHYDIYDVGADGAPVEIQSADGGGSTIAQQVWRRISTLNADPNRSRPAVGRIVVVREPSPIMFANLHYVFNQHFDMDQIFAILKNEDPELAFPHQAFAKDVRHRTSFVVTFEYFTLIGEKCKPMSWQRSDKEKEVDENHISISRCSSVVALSLEADKPMVQVRNRDRRIQRKYGDVYDPFSPWRVLCIQAYPDWKATTGIHKPHHHYANGPEAFLVTLEAEFNDARSRMKAVYDAVADLVEPPADFLFDKELRDQMLFEDENFTYSRKYFWAYQTLSIINSDITEMIDAYRETFKDSVWDGTNKIIWPGESSQSSRYLHWRKKMAKIRKEIEYEIQKLEDIQTLIHKKLRVCLPAVWRSSNADCCPPGHQSPPRQSLQRNDRARVSTYRQDWRDYRATEPLDQIAHARYHFLPSAHLRDQCLWHDQHGPSRLLRSLCMVHNRHLRANLSLYWLPEHKRRPQSVALATETVARHFRPDGSSCLALHRVPAPVGGGLFHGSTRYGKETGR